VSNNAQYLKLAPQ